MCETAAPPAPRHRVAAPSAVERALGFPLRDDRAFLLLFAALALLAAIPPLVRPINLDAGWFLYLARRWLGGARLYVDYIDPNPPLVVFLSAPAALLDGLFGVSAAGWFDAAVAVAALLSAATATALLRRLLERKSEARFLGLLALFLLLALPQGDFGQREHLMFLAVLPYLVLAAGRAGGPARIGVRTTWLAAIGAVAGVGFALKPHFLPALLLVELYVAAVHRSRRAWRRPETFAALAAMMLYGLAALPLVPRYLHLVRTLFGPGYLHFHAVPAADILRTGRMTFFAAAAVAWLALRPGGALRRTGDVLFLALVAFAASVLLQGKGFSYHWYPALATAVLLSAVVLLQAMRRVAAMPAPLRLVAPAATLALTFLTLLFALSLARAAFHPPSPRERDAARMLDIVRERAYAGRVLFLSTRMQDAFPLLVYTDATLAGPLPHLWPVAVSLTPDVAPAAAGRMDAYVLDVVGAAVAAAPPDLIVVDTSPVLLAGGGTRRVDMLRYFARDARFRAALGRYRRLATVGHDVLYRRVAAADALVTPPARR